MKLLKGIAIGCGITAAFYMMYYEGMINKRRIIKNARKMANKLGIDC